MDIFINSLEQSLLFFPLVLGVYLSYSILRVTDMTVEGSFVLGAGLFAKLLSLGNTVLLSGAAAIAAGLVAGLAIALIQRHGKIQSLIAGIIGVFMLYSINLQVMGRPNIGLQDLNGISPVKLLIIIVSLALVFGFLMKTRVGLMLRAFGSNAGLLKTLGKSNEFYRMLGLSLSNGLAALCGVLTAVQNGFADIHMGFGMALIAICTVMIGGQLLKGLFEKKSFAITYEILACFVGVYIYFIGTQILLTQGIDPIHLKLVLGLGLIVLLRSVRYA